MPYGTIKVDNITFDNGGTDKLLTVSGLFFSTSGALTVTGTISGGNVTAPAATFTTLTGTTTAGTTATFTSGSFTSVTGTTVTGTTANFTSGVFTTRVSGTTVTGTTANFTSGNFTSLSGTTTTVTSGVFSAGSATAPSVAVGTGTSNAPGIYSPGTDQLAISTNSTGRVFVDGSGNLGLGVTPSAWFTGSNWKAIDLPSAAFRGGNQGAAIYANSYVNSSVASIYKNSGAYALAYQQQADTGNHAWFIAPSGTAGNTISFTQAMTLSANGRLGIGASSPGYALTVSDGTRVGFIQPSSGLNSVNFGVATNHPMVFVTNDQERARIDTSGRLGIGTSSPAQILHLSKLTNVDTYIQITNSLTSSYYGTSADGKALTWNAGAYPLVFGTSDTERARIDSSGRSLVGTSSARANLYGSTYSPTFQLETSADLAERGMSLCYNGGTSGGGSILALITSRGTIAGSNTIVANGDELGVVNFLGTDGVKPIAGATVAARVDGTPGVDDMPGRLVFSTTADGAASPTPRMTITSGGDIVTVKTAVDFSVVGVELKANGSGVFTTNGIEVLSLNRKTSDGDLLRFFQDQTQEGSISVSGTTVSYNGAHLSRWSQLPSGAERTEILRGSVLSNIDEMCEWTDEENEQLNRMKVSDVEGDKNVSGVFQAWDDDDDTYTNDFYCAMTGDFIIRIAGDVTVERGDLLMSAGDGTAKPQDDDIIRSKTIAKVTSTNVSCTYEDGSYCVPCVLMAC